jgi:Mismatch repair ATPase (MutS family)
MKTNKLEQKIGFNYIKEAIKECCLSDGGKRLVENITFSSSFETVSRWVEMTDEFKQIFMTNATFPSSDYFDMRSVLERLKVIGSFISVEELFNLKGSLRTICDCLNFFSKAEDERYPLLKELCKNIFVDKEIMNQCNRLIDEKGEIYDSASGDLIIIRSSIRRKKSEVERRIQGILSVSKREGWTSSDAEITIRDNRLVIPMASSYKRKIKGLVHDESSSGQTSYIEPEEIVELNNQLKELQIKERKEIIKILCAFTDLLRPQIEILFIAYYFLVQIDFIRAKAKYAMQIGAGKPILNSGCVLQWFSARHPLLERSLQKNGKNIVPLDIELSEQKRILIISGPNAGGKSVCLKTVGLLQYMLQCGLLVPIRETSECGIFSSLYIDIGDEQSLENDLSTYSSHLLNMKMLCSKASDKTLFMIDECGTGTDPSIGGAIAESVLEYLNKRRCFGVVTTHYSNLKLLADKNENIVNGAMLFDSKNMKPLYKLSIGKPGSSFALEIAKTIGLEEEILNSAMHKIGTPHLNFEQQLQQLEVEKLALKKKQEEVRVADELLAEVLQKYNTLKTHLEEEKNRILKDAKSQAKEIIQNANKDIENTIAQIKAANADNEQTKIIRKGLRLTQSKLEKEIAFGDKAQAKIDKQNSGLSNNQTQSSDIVGLKGDDSELNIGDIVRIGADNNYAEVVAIKGKRVEVQSNNLRLTINRDSVSKVDKSAYQKQREKQISAMQSNYSSVLSDINDQQTHFSVRLDVRGQRAEDALEMVDKFIDKAALLGQRELSVLHGKGNGILKTIIRDYLRKNSNVKDVRVAKVEFGGEGITEITLL